MKDQKDVLKKFKGISIGTDYKGKNIYASDVVKEDDLIGVMYDWWSRESDIDEEGIKFFSEYWGFEKIADIIFDYEEVDGDFHRAFKTKEKFVNWLGQGKEEVRSLTKEEKIKLEIRNAFFKKYSNIKLGGLIDVKEKEYYIAQLNTEDQVSDFLVNLSKGITYLTVMGYEFLKDFYGFKYLSVKLFEKYPQFSKGSIEQNLEWLVKDKHLLIRK